MASKQAAGNRREGNKYYLTRGKRGGEGILVTPSLISSPPSLPLCPLFLILIVIFIIQGAALTSPTFCLTPFPAAFPLCSFSPLLSSLSPSLSCGTSLTTAYLHNPLYRLINSIICVSFLSPFVFKVAPIASRKNNLVRVRISPSAHKYERETDRTLVHLCTSNQYRDPHGKW